MPIYKLIMSGGLVLIILSLCSIISCAVIVERCLYYFKRSKVKRADFMAGIKKELKAKNIEYALKLCKKANTPFSEVVHAGISFDGHGEKEISNNMERAIVIETNLLERYTTIVGTIGSIAVYIGLFGTVLGIMKAFNDISTSGTGGINVVTSGIAESLISTAAGLCVAIPAVVAYNYFIKRVDNFITDMELCASETADLVKVKER